MPFSLSVRQKLIAIVLLVSLGYAGFGAYSVFELNQMSQASDDATELGNLTTRLKNVEIRLLKVERQTALLKPASVQSMHAELADIRATLNQRLGINPTLLNSQAMGRLSATHDLLPSYLNAIEAYVNTKTQLGLTSQLGALGKLNQEAKQLADKLRSLDSFAALFKDVLNRQKDFLAYSDSSHQQALESALQTLKSSVTNIGFGDVFNPLITQYENALQPVVTLSFRLQTEQQALSDLSQRSLQSMDDTTGYVQHTVLSEAERLSKHTAQQARQSVVIGCVLLALVIGVVLITVIRSLNRNLASVLTLLNQVAQGKLTHHDLSAANHHNDEFQQLLKASNKMSEGLRNLVQHLLQSNQNLFQTARELDSNVHTIIRGSERIRDRSNTLAASTEEISVTADTVRSRANSVQQSTQTAHNTAAEGARVIQAAMVSISDVATTIESTHERVDRLGVRSKEIDVVIDLIIDVANQTSLLALNAAIEAARAGEAGRGFAVVADEVKALADQTVKASGDITSKVEGIQQETLAVVQAMSLSLEKVADSKTLGERAVNTIHQVELHSQEAMSNTRDITHSITEVALTTAQMAQDMDQIAQEITENYQATQSIQVASQDVHHQCQELQQQINRFDLS